MSKAKPHGNVGSRKSGKYAVVANDDDVTYTVAEWIPQAARVRSILAERGTRRKAFAKALNISDQYLSMLLNPYASGRVPSRAFIEQMARVLEVEPETLLPE